MNTATPKTVGLTAMPSLAALILARKQARWQWKNCADEHKHKWTRVVNMLDQKIRLGEIYIATIMDMDAFHWKRVITE